MDTSTRLGTERADDWSDKEKNTAHYSIRTYASIIIVLFLFKCTFLVGVQYYNNAHKTDRYNDDSNFS